MLDTHPDFENFKKLGSPFAVISRRLNGSLHDCQDDHYSNDQYSFSYISWNGLIGLINDFEVNQLFNAHPNSVSEEEIENAEQLYKKITEIRVGIFRSTQPKCEASSDNFQDLYSEMLRKISYRDSMCQLPTYTNFATDSERNIKYGKAGKVLTLSEVVNLMEVPELAIDQQIILGKLEYDQDDGTVHHMGCYRSVGAEENYQCADERIQRVDEITALALKKSLQSNRGPDILKYGFIFSTLRGYNPRSVIGAAFAHEMSLRFVLAKKGLRQFFKQPAIMLDVEAVSTDIFPDDQNHFKNFIEKQVADYTSSLLGTITSKSFFDDVGNLDDFDNSFVRYLIENDKYREEDLEDIINYVSEEGESAFEIMIRTGNKNFFSLVSNNEEILEMVLAKIERDDSYYDLLSKTLSYKDDEMFNCVLNILRTSSKWDKNEISTDESDDELNLTEFCKKHNIAYDESDMMDHDDINYDSEFPSSSIIVRSVSASQSYKRSATIIS